MAVVWRVVLADRRRHDGMVNDPDVYLVVLVAHRPAIQALLDPFVRFGLREPLWSPKTPCAAPSTADGGHRHLEEVGQLRIRRP
jgi:hypothetical protein